MRIEITECGVHDAENKEITVGTVLDIKGDVLPAAFVNKCKIVKGEPDKAAMINNGERKA